MSGSADAAQEQLLRAIGGLKDAIESNTQATKDGAAASDRSAEALIEFAYATFWFTVIIAWLTGLLLLDATEPTFLSSCPSIFRIGNTSLTDLGCVGLFLGFKIGITATFIVGGFAISRKVLPARSKVH